MWRPDQDKRPMVFLIGTVAVLAILLYAWTQSDSTSEVPEHSTAVSASSPAEGPSPVAPGGTPASQPVPNQ